MINMPQVWIISSPNTLAKQLAEELAEKQCSVKLITSQEELRKSMAEENKADYVFLIQGFSSQNDFLTPEKLKLVLDFVQLQKIKTQIILPYVVTSLNRELVERTAKRALEASSDFLNVIYLGEILSQGMDISSQSFLAKVFKSIWQKSTVKIPLVDFDLYLIDAKTASRNLIRGIFSYGFQRREIVITDKVSTLQFFRKLKDFYPELNFVTDPSIYPLATVSNFDFINAKVSDDEIKETLEWVRTSVPATNSKRMPRQIEIPKIPRIVIKRNYGFRSPLRNFRIFPRKIIVLVLVLFWILGLPFLSFFASSQLLKQGFISLNEFNLERADFYFNASKNLSHFSKTTFSVYEVGKGMANMVYDFADTGQGMVDVLNLASKSLNNSRNTDAYDFKDMASQLYLVMDSLHKKVSFLEAGAKNVKGQRVFLPEYDFQSISKILASGKDMAKLLPHLLGGESQKSYLILLQDNNELRATGGKIDSFAVFTFSGGKLNANNFYGVESVDRQLKGYIDPPTPLSKYLKINGWNFSNSNWEADFAVSSSRAEWFLKNSISQEIDGVIGVDLKTFNKLKDFKEGNLTWGSEVLKGVMDGKIQVFLNNEEAYNIIRKLGWDGGVNFPKCEGNSICLASSLVQSNLGGNKIDNLVLKSGNLQVDLTGGVVRNKFEIDFNNTSKELYKNYVRILTPSNSNFGSVTVKVNKTSNSLIPDTRQIGEITEAGVFIEIPSGQTGQIIFNWTNKNTLDYKTHGRVSFYTRHQPGIENMPIKIDFKMPSGLTKDQPSSYNTNLKADIDIELSF